MAKTSKKRSKKKWKHGEGKWERLEDPDELRRLAAKYTSRTAILRAVGFATVGGEQFQRIKNIAEAEGIELPRGSPGPQQKYPVATEDGEASGLSEQEEAAAKEAIARVRHDARLADAGGLVVGDLRKQVKLLQGEIEKQRTVETAILDMMRGCVAALEPVEVRPPIYATDHETKECVIIAPWSDLHVGELQTTEDTAGLGGYDWPTFCQRCDAYIEAFDKIVNGILRQAIPIHNLILPIMGDIATGEAVFKKQGAYIDLRAMQQVLQAVKRLCGMILWMARQFKRIDVYTVPGNHGNVPDMTFNIDQIIYYFMAMLLEDQPNVHMHIAENTFMAWKIDKTTPHFENWPEGCEQEHKILIDHGDAIRSYLAQPSYGIERAVKDYCQMLNVAFTLALFAHFHNAGMLLSDTIFINGSWVGGSDLSVGKLRRVSGPYQLLFLFHAEYGVISNFPIHFGVPTPAAVLDEGQHIYTPHTNGMIEAVEPQGAA